jgi:hypothetical protein
MEQPLPISTLHQTGLVSLLDPACRANWSACVALRCWIIFPVHIAGHLILFGQPRSNTRQMVLCQAVDALRG